MRFDIISGEPYSLSFISFSQLLKPSRYGDVYFELLVDEWPDEIRETVLALLQQLPLAEFLQLSSYAPAHAHRIVPLATIKQPHLALQPA